MAIRRLLRFLGRPFYGVLLLTTQILLLLDKLRLPSLPPLPHFSKKFFLIGIIAGLPVFLISSFYLFILKELPGPNQLATRERMVTTKIFDRHGQLLYKIYRHQNRSLVKLEDVPLFLVQATLAIEDAEFYQHHGFSPKGILRAMVKNLRGDKLYGGSTITQQLVKNALLTPERTVRRKIREVILALVVEQKFTKDKILQMYLNQVGYGGAAYGVEEASQMYFNKPVNQINLAEAALLAGLPASPTRFSPFGSHPEKAKARQKLVLRRMREENFITYEEETKTVNQELHFAPQRTDIKAPHFVMYVKEWLVNKYGERMVEEGGLRVTTTLDLDIQQAAQKIVSSEISQLKRLRISNGAALVTRPATGEILAMVGSTDYFDQENDGNVNVTLRLRQPGSAIKPVTYSLALANGFTTTTIIPDTPISYQVPGQPPYSPRNYDHRFHGNTPLRIALASSYNVPAVKVLSALGVSRMIEQGQKMGITTWDNPSRFGLSLTLGGGEVKMIDMAVVYGVLANQGIRANLNPILEVKDYQDKTWEKIADSSLSAHAADQTRQAAGKQVIDNQIAYLLTRILADNSARTPAFGPRSWLVIPDHPHVAVKTGTSQNMRDNWTIGYSSDFLTAVWVGNNDNTPMSYVASGVTGASPIWHRIMKFLLEEIPDKEFMTPEGLVHIEICPLTDTLACPGCGGKWEYFVAGTEPKTRCSWQQFLKKPSQTPTPTQ